MTNSLSTLSAEKALMLRLGQECRLDLSLMPAPVWVLAHPLILGSVWVLAHP